MTHHRADGFKFEPNSSKIYWLVCDMVEKPAKVTSLMIQWLVKGWCREAILTSSCR
ncbi:hypothetical protein M8494_00765 [Serratia ureilytica]